MTKNISVRNEPDFVTDLPLTHVMGVVGKLDSVNERPKLDWKSKQYVDNRYLLRKKRILMWSLR